MNGPSLAEAPTARPSGIHYVLWMAALNVPFAVCHPAGPVVTAAVPRSLAINLVLFVLPGMPLTGVLIGFGWLKRSSWMCVVSLSLAVFMGLVVACRLVGLPVESSPLWNATWVIVNLGAGLNVLAGGEPAWGMRWRMPGEAIGAAIFLAAYAAYFYGACYIVENQEDHDCKVQATVHALLTRLRPESRLAVAGASYFSHPPLVHVCVAGSFLYYNRFEPGRVRSRVFRGRQPGQRRAL